MPRDLDEPDQPDEPDEPGWALKRLLVVHDGMRDDLALLRRAVLAVARADRTVDAAAAVAALGEVSFRDPAWSLRRYCDRFCRFVHDHHAVEDGMLFPVLLAERNGRNGRDDRDGGLGKVIEQLQADHRVLARHLDDVERAIKAAPDDAAAKTAAVEAIELLSEHLEEHLTFEETSLAPALNALSAVVAEDDLPPPPPPPVT